MPRTHAQWGYVPQRWRVCRCEEPPLVPNTGEDAYPPNTMKRYVSVRPAPMAVENRGLHTQIRKRMCAPQGGKEQAQAEAGYRHNNRFKEQLAA